MVKGKETVNYRWRQRNGCDGRSVAKFLIRKPQVNFGLPHSSFTRDWHRVVVIKIFATDLPSQSFLNCISQMEVILPTVPECAYSGPRMWMYISDKSLYGPL